jgi:hypothetical protein
MTIDHFAVNKLLNSESKSAQQLGWLLYNRKDGATLSELDEMAVLMARVVDEVTMDSLEFRRD